MEVNSHSINTARQSRIQEIDLLRFLAALAVVLYHYTFRGVTASEQSIMPYPWLAPVAMYGYLGVNLFFLISGFVILMTASSGSLKSFFTSRVSRLYPAFWACCTVTFLAILAIGAPRHTATLTQYLVNMTMLSEFFGVQPIDGVYWSLFVEIKFYAMVAMVLAIRKINHAQRFLAIWLLASIALVVFPNRRILRDILIVDYAAYFIAGATLYLVWREGWTMTRLTMVATSWVLALYQSRLFANGLTNHFATVFEYSVVAGLITLFFIIMALVAAKRTGIFGRTNWLLLGAITYPLYLLHETVGYMIFNVAYPTINPHVLLWGMIFAMLLVAYAVHVLVEKPFAPRLRRVLNKAIESMAGRFNAKTSSQAHTSSPES
jgi:peptidoglycan/LPS O-acetylase OafA/YrhL